MWLAMWYNTSLSDLSVSRFFSEDRCLNRYNILFAISWIEDCMELHFKYVEYQTLAHLSYSSCVSLTSRCAARAQRFLSVRVLISDSSNNQGNYCSYTIMNELSITLKPWAGFLAFMSTKIYAWPLPEDIRCYLNHHCSQNLYCLWATCRRWFVAVQTRSKLSCVLHFLSSLLWVRSLMLPSRSSPIRLPSAQARYS